MNSKTAKALRKFAELRQFPYTQVKHLFESRSREQQRIDLWMMRKSIRLGVKNIMAEQKLCDRPHHVVIPANSEYYQMTFRTPEGEKKIDLCGPCGLDFKAFMETTPAQQPAAPVNPAGQEQPAVPANPVEQPAA